MGHFFPITSRHNVRTYFLKLGNTSRPSPETPIHKGFPVSETSRQTSRDTSRDTSRMTSRPYNRGMWHRERMTGGWREVSATDLPSQNPFPQRRFKRKREVGRSTTSIFAPSLDSRNGYWQLESYTHIPSPLRNPYLQGLSAMVHVMVYAYETYTVPQTLSTSRFQPSHGIWVYVEYKNN